MYDAKNFDLIQIDEHKIKFYKNVGVKIRVSAKKNNNNIILFFFFSTTY